MASTPLPIVQYWHSPERPSYIEERMASFGRLNPERPHLVFDERSAGAFIAEHFGGRELAAFRACGPPAMQADFLRCCAILELGGVWADAGLTCVRNLDSLLLPSPDGTLFRWPSRHHDLVLMNSLFAFPIRGHQFLQLWLEVSVALIEMRWPGLVSEVTGPALMTAIYQLGRTGSTSGLMEAIGDEAPHADRLRRHGEVVSRAIGEPARAVEACTDLSVHPPRRYRKWALASGKDLPHRASADYWPLLGTEIYAERHG